MIQLTLQGKVPSKKNARKVRMGQAKSYLPAQIQADIDALIIQAQAQRHTLHLKDLEGKKLRVICEFHVWKEQVDLDNAFTTLLDVLQKAGIISNDKLVRSFGVDEIKDADRAEGVCITIHAL